jgi:hypothetical protein
MPEHERKRPAYYNALQFEHLVVRILDGIRIKRPRASRDLEEYTSEMLRCFRRSNNCPGTEQGRQESFRAAVWMVEVLIVLINLQNKGVERALITAAIEVAERIESDLRAEGALPPALDSP